MSLFAMSDLHLPLGAYKPMDVFGERWQNYVNRIRENWQATVGADDVVIINGDVCWATYLENALADFEFINNLNGIKLISKGNHDYWWSTVAKMDAFLLQNGFKNIHFLRNNIYEYQGCAICSARGWIAPDDKDFSAEDDRIYRRELLRLGMSLDAAKKSGLSRIVAALHFPPSEGFLEVLDDAAPEICVFGHLHGKAAQSYVPKRENHFLVSADFLAFKPLKLL